MYRAKWVCEPCAHEFRTATGTERVPSPAGAVLHHQRDLSLRRTGVRRTAVRSRRAARSRMAADHERGVDLRRVAAAMAIVVHDERGRATHRHRLRYRARG